MLSINIQVGLGMHLYDDIGDASSSLRGSTSSSMQLQLQNSIVTRRSCNKPHMSFNRVKKILANIYASSSSKDAYCDRQLTPNFELLAEVFVYRHVSIWGFRNNVCPSPEKSPSFINISLSVLIPIWMERSSRVLKHGNLNIWFSFTEKYKLNFDLCWRACCSIQFVQDIRIPNSCRVSIFTSCVFQFRYHHCLVRSF